MWLKLKNNWIENQSLLKEVSPGCSLEELMLKLKLQYFGHLMWRADSFEKTLMLGKIERGRRRGWQRMRWLDGITNSMTWVWVGSASWWWPGRHGVLQCMGLQSRTRLSDWTELDRKHCLGISTSQYAQSGLFLRLTLGYCYHWTWSGLIFWPGCSDFRAWITRHQRN